MGETVQYLASVLREQRHVLEVGCGDGEVARRLAEHDLAVTALDLPSAPLRAAARSGAAGPFARERGAWPAARGVTYVEADFLTYKGPPVDAVVFTASLHHLAPLAAALDRAFALAPIVVVDDFDLEMPDTATASWYFRIQELLAKSPVYAPRHVHGAPTDEPVARWRAAHEPGLHTGAQMKAALAVRATIRELSRVPYLYRHVCAGLAATEDGANVAAHVFATERRGISLGTLKPVGLRIVAVRA